MDYIRNKANLKVGQRVLQVNQFTIPPNLNSSSLTPFDFLIPLILDCIWFWI